MRALTLLLCLLAWLPEVVCKYKFLTPPEFGGTVGDFRNSAEHPIGSDINLAWDSDDPSIPISLILYQQDGDRTLQPGEYIFQNLTLKTDWDWVVFTKKSLKVSSNFFFSIFKEGDSSPTITSHYFNITRDSEPSRPGTTMEPTATSIPGPEPTSETTFESTPIITASSTPASTTSSTSTNSATSPTLVPSSTGPDASAIPTSTSPPPQEPPEDERNSLVPIGLGVGIPIVVLIFMFIGWYFLRRRRQKRRREEERDAAAEAKEEPPSPRPITGVHEMPAPRGLNELVTDPKHHAWELARTERVPELAQPGQAQLEWWYKHHAPLDLPELERTDRLAELEHARQLWELEHPGQVWELEHPRQVWELEHARQVWEMEHPGQVWEMAHPRQVWELEHARQVWELAVTERVAELENTARRISRWSFKGRNRKVSIYELP